MNKRLRRQIEAAERAKAVADARAQFDRFVYHTAKARGVNPDQLAQIDPGAEPDKPWSEPGSNPAADIRAAGSTKRH